MQIRFARIANTTALLLAAFCLTPAMSAHAADKPAAEAKAESMRAEFSPFVKAYEEAMKNKDFKTAMEKLALMDGVANRTEFEDFSIWRMRVATASSMGDNPATAAAIEKTLSFKRLSPEDQNKFGQALIGIRYNMKEYGKVVELLDAQEKTAALEPNLRNMRIQALYFQKDYKRAIAEARKDFEVLAKEGKTPLEDSLKLLLNCYVSLNDKDGYVEGMSLLATHYPRKEYWEDLLGRYIGSTKNADRFIPSFYRLKFFMNMMNGADEYTDMADLLLRFGQPGEAKRVLDKGFEAGVLGKGGDAKKLNALRDRVNKAAADDAKSLDSVSPAKVKDGSALVNAGYALLINGSNDKGLALIEQGLKMPSKKADETRLLAAIGYAHAGKKDEAIKLLATVQSADGATELAKYWSMNLAKPLLQ
ncbi:hypothetical protein V8J88_07345 [Massilia sp. W12]|uniref:hypothetical protein n=1 Tax=Massilia sp. W12 TaxID=3126507 RepID=UPI0030CF1A73